MRFGKKNGFTLIELLIVIAILALLIIMGMMAWRAQVNKARDAQRKADLQRLRVAFEDYYSDNECYPVNDILETCLGDQLDPYLNKVPCDPTTRQPYCYVTDEDNPDCFQSFRILSSLDFDSDPIIAELGCDTEAGCGYDDICAQNGLNYGVSSGNIFLANPDIPQALPSPSPSPLPSVVPGSYACDPTGICNSYQNPQDHGCPLTFSDPIVCQQYCDASPNNWCNS
jgi:prepilin-type N-terminal cleavage/methylation domain-containing protein